MKKETGKDIKVIYLRVDPETHIAIKTAAALRGIPYQTWVLSAMLKELAKEETFK